LMKKNFPSDFKLIIKIRNYINIKGVSTSGYQ
jgi:hypothetical protein